MSLFLTLIFHLTTVAHYFASSVTHTNANIRVRRCPLFMIAILQQLDHDPGVPGRAVTMTAPQKVR